MRPNASPRCTKIAVTSETSLRRRIVARFAKSRIDLPNRFTKEIRLLVKEDNYLNDRD
jgi:hypothetical protein